MIGFIQKIRIFLFANNDPGQTVAKNTAWLFTGQMASRALRALIVIYAARLLGVASWGAFSYALGVATFLTVFSDIGIGALLTREGAKSPEMRSRYLATAIGTKLFLLTGIALLVIAFFPYLTKIEEAAAIMPILIFVFIFDTLRDLGSAFSRALEKMEVEAILQIFTNACIVALGFLALTLQGTSYALALAYAAGSGLGLLGMFYALRRHLKGVFRNFSLRLVKEIIVAAWPFGLFGIMGIVMLNTDVIMLGWLRTPEEVGYYAAAQKLVQLLYVIPTIVATAIFPTLTRLAKTHTEEAKRLLERNVARSFVAAIPIAAIGVLLGPWIIKLSFGAAYEPATYVFQILMATVLIIFPSALVGNAVFAYGETRSFARFAFFAIVGNVAADALLIPYYGIEGAAIATVIIQLLTNGLIWHKMKRLNGFTVLPEIKNVLSQLTQRKTAR